MKKRPTRGKPKNQRAPPKLPLLINDANLPETAALVRDLLSEDGRFFERGRPVRVVRSRSGAAPRVVRLDKDGVVTAVHALRQPARVTKTGLVPVTLPD